MNQRRWTAIVLAILGLVVVSLWRVQPPERPTSTVVLPDPAIAGH